MLKRKAYNILKSWHTQPNKKALCIIGARQIGKTTLIRQFAQNNYEHFAELNFVLDQQAHSIFADSLDADTIITNLTAYTKKPLTPGKTLIFLDEIQACPNARTAIKFLVEDGRFDYIESGSLLGVNYNDVRSYPVGFEEIHYMYPLDFEEYMWANGVQAETIAYLQRCVDTLTPVTEAVHQTMLKLFFSYIVVGGMPEVVQTYVSTHDIGQVIERQNNILSLYRLDIAKYTSGSNKIKVQAIFDIIPSQLNDKNRRFMLSKIDSNGRQNRYQDSFLWLADAGVALPCYNVTEPQPPLQINEKHNLFKLFMGDTGLLCAACMDNIQYSILQGDLEVNLGSILENVMAQSIKSNGFKLNFFDSKKYGELDFVIQNGMQTDLLEIKSGKSYKIHASLNKLLKVEEWHFGQALVFCKGNIEKADKTTYLPWYAIIFYRPRRIAPHTTYQVDLSALQALPKQ
ncbi:AAA family ATPase [uncultured Phascolarctobacterium sp.]|uniref:ATP-binding protein n=1 Tax=uncultured Phascolarctobacterium sp. TaxID=512296 RepID=UPI00261A31BA|nr:AAA family ATPase [uncultured Phascolarctobacterium sp.]